MSGKTYFFNGNRQIKKIYLTKGGIEKQIKKAFLYPGNRNVFSSGYTIRYHLPDSTISIVDIEEGQDAITTAPSVTPTSGYTFVGWSLSSGGDTISSYVPTEDADLYAIQVVTSSLNKSFGYTGGMQSYTAPVTGTYRLQVWGAKGGNATMDDGYTGYGGNGGYAYGNVKLTKGTTIYIGVGGAGGNSADSAASGGVNGGGNGGYYYGSGGGCGGAGGGATHIGKSNAWLRSTAVSNLYIAAGGGGGGGCRGISYRYNGGAGGGTNGGNGGGNYDGYLGHGGTQSAGGLSGAAGRAGYGYGYSGDTSDIYNAGGGGGYYGGGAGRYYCGAGGGSGYIGGVTGGGMSNGQRNTHGYASITFVS